MNRSGFTIIEVTLVLAISMFLFVGVIGGTNVNITRQRYNDSVNSFAEFLRSQYSEVISTENTRDDRISNTSPCTLTSKQAAGNGSGSNVETGRSHCLIYGKLITFNEENNPAKVYSYDIIGDAKTSNDLEALNKAVRKNSSHPYHGISNDTILSLVNLNADVLTARSTGSGCQIIPAGNTSTYELPWGAYVQTTNHPTMQNYTGSILIVRSPLSGAINTFRLNSVVPVQSRLRNPYIAAEYCNANSDARVNAYNNGSLRSFLSATGSNAPSFGNASTGTVAEFCINSDDVFALASNGRRMVSIAYDGYNASAVKVYNQDQGENKCQ